MERASNTKKTYSGSASAILTADWHLREDQPICRTDDFWETQWRKIRFIAELQNDNNNCPIIHAGDLFNHWKPSPWLLSMALLNLPDGNTFYTVCGNHDLPQHNLDNVYKSGMQTLANAGKIEILPNGHWGQSIKEGQIFNEALAVWHGLVFPKDGEGWPGVEGTTANKLLSKCSSDIVVTGHNHTPFVEKGNKKILVNPGSITRQTADQSNMRPRVYLWWERSNDVQPVYLPIDENVISRNHLVDTNHLEERQNRMEAFLQLLHGEGWEADVSFEQNLQRLMDKRKLANSVREIILGAIGK